MGKHAAPDPERLGCRHRITRGALHPLTHIVTLVGLHVAALTVIEKTPLLTFLFLH
ncbi:hypothetical protein [Cryptosporangium arvum]|uniref:Uncharacterized protein n=1 Tax=Cryptosporangium arvum DSM 44712 TaxID=927661 RepID=A0A010ZTE6_9ACTN|nr:hypothetical protein [Cryptosporangium arvum]EXG81979.1 hypothetical protein CryarDRAFT_3106 [Cryptosporangium arvum DSM 44712]